MYSQRLKSLMEKKKFLTAAPGTPVSEAARLMARKGVGAILVVQQKRLVGIFTERDAVFRVIAKGRDPQATRLADVMTPEPQTAHSMDSFGHALLMMHEGGFRHVPVVENGEPLGIVSARYALDPEMEEFVSEAERRRHFSVQHNG